ncbi:MAG: DNA-processing protein DprA [Clostridia bacterium]|nr:DNA-processing protein DprA [Clostridia bacterium]
MRESEAMAVLVAAQGVGYAAREAALRAAGSAMALLAEPKHYAKQLGEKGLSALRRSMADGQVMLDTLYAQDVHLIVRGSEGYPPLLAQTARPPHLLFVLGKADLCDRFPLAVVGTRRAGAYGLRHTRMLCRELAGAGMCIVSGLALGIDSAAHEGALDAGGRTIAVLGGALDRLYPAGNRGLMERILAGGGSVVSEYAPGFAPTRYSFLERNRIIAGLSLGVMVTEAPARSGAMSTAQRALDEGREVFALPGDIDRENSRLPNRLIAEGAHPVTCAGDVLSQMVIEPGRAPARAKEKAADEKAAGIKAGNEKAESRIAAQGKAAPAALGLTPDMDPGERKILELLLTGDLDFDQLCEGTGMDADELGAALMMLELEGKINALPGCMYRLA